MGMAIGSFVSVFGKNKIHSLFAAMNEKRLSLFGIVPACILGIASPLCMYGTIPIAASFNEKGMREDWLASFMMASILLNPQLIIYSTALGRTALIIRIASCFACGIFAGLAVNLYNKLTKKKFFSFSSFYEISNHDTDPNIFLRYIKNFGRNLKATGFYFLLGIFLTALFQRYVPAESFARFFGRKNGFGVLMAATIGVPLYACINTMACRRNEPRECKRVHDNRPGHKNYKFRRFENRFRRGKIFCLSCVRDFIFSYKRTRC